MIFLYSEISRSRGVISHESLEPGYIAVSFIALSQSRLRHQQQSLRYCPSLAIPMASAVTYRRQLAPTVGHAEALSGVLIRTGPSSSSSARATAGLVLRVGTLVFVVMGDASRSGAGALLPRGTVVPTGNHRVFVTSVADVYPREVRVSSGTSDPSPPSCCSSAPDGSAPRVCAGVVVAGTASSHGVSAVATAGPSGQRDVLGTLVGRAADLAVAQAGLERARQQLAERTKLVDAERRRLEATIREYNAALMAAPRTVEPAIFEDFLFFGRADGQEPIWTMHPAASSDGSHPAYSSVERNLRAAMQVAGGLETLEGDELRGRERRMRELLVAASRQQAEIELHQKPELHPATGAGRRPDESPQQNQKPGRRARRSARKQELAARGQAGQPDALCGKRQVAAVQGQETPGAAGGSQQQQRQKRSEYTFESMLDAPCKFHSSVGRSAMHSTRGCGWTTRLAQEAVQACPGTGVNPCSGRPGRSGHVNLTNKTVESHSVAPGAANCGPGGCHQQFGAHRETLHEALLGLEGLLGIRAHPPSGQRGGPSSQIGPHQEDRR